MDLEIRDEFIKLGQALKLAGIASSGIDAKIMIEDGLVLVNGETEIPSPLREIPLLYAHRSNQLL